MLHLMKNVLFSIVSISTLCTAACFAQNAPGDLVGKSTGNHPYNGFGEGQMFVKEDGRVFIYQNLQTNDDRDKRIIVMTPNKPMDTLTTIPDIAGRFDVRSVLILGERGFIVTWTSLSHPENTKKYYFSIGDLPENPDDDLGIIVDVYMVQAATYSGEYLSEILADSGYEADQIDNIWIDALEKTGKLDMALSSRNNCEDCDSGGPGSTGCTIGGPNETIGVTCGAGYYTCCKYNDIFKSTAVCCLNSE